MGNLRKFRYQELDSNKQFRILTILEGNKDAKIRCKLRHSPLPSISPALPKYDAVSWTWGDQDNPEQIVIVPDSESGEEERYFPVSLNLADALRGLRLANSAKDVWIDALCIWQENTHERDLQVQLMFDIYTNAQNVSVWLGNHDKDSHRALKFIKDRVCDLGAWEHITESEGSREEWSALAALINRPWFSRRWVVQEIALARKATVHCGDSVIDWTDFETAVSLFTREAPRIATHYKNKHFDHDSEIFGDVAAMGATRLVQAKSNLFRVDEEGKIVEWLYTLTDLVSNLSSFEAREPHDLIYAILSLAKDTRLRIGIDQPAGATNETASSASNHSSHLNQVSSDQVQEDQVSVQPQQSDRNNETPFSTSEATEESLATKRKLNDMTSGGRSAVERAIKRARHAAQPENRKLFKVEYGKPFFDVCKEFLSFTIPKTGFPNLDILCRPWAPKQEDKILPSWIPNVKNAAFGPREARRAPGGRQIKRKNADPLVGQTTDGRPHYNACRGQEAQPDDWKFGDRTKGEDHMSLFLTGFVLDSIGEIEAASMFGNVTSEWLQLGRWKMSDDSFGPEFKAEPPDELWRTLVADRGPDGGNIKQYYRKALHYAVNYSTSGTGLQTTELKQQGHPILGEFLQRMEAVVWNRKLFRSKRKECLGLAPKQAEKGDRVCILRGCSVPVILRPFQAGQQYSFIGECYLHTMMTGQAIDVQDRDGLQTEVFELR